MFVLMFEPALKCQENAIFMQNYSLKLFITFKMAYSCFFSLRGNLDFPDFLQKSFITLTTVWTDLAKFRHFDKIYF